MTQIATVERILDDTHAEISVPRKSMYDLWVRLFNTPSLIAL